MPACPNNVWNHTNGCDCAAKMAGAEQNAAFPAWGGAEDTLPPVGSLATAPSAPVRTELVPEEPDVTYAFGEEGCLCPKCQNRVEYPHATSSGVVQCPNPRCALVFRAGFADPQCGNCREFLDDPDAEDDSLCESCTTSGGDDEYPDCAEGGHVNDDNPGSRICRTCADDPNVAMAYDVPPEQQYGIRSITEDAFDTEFGGTVEGPEGSHVWEQDPREDGIPDDRIWSVVEGDNGGEYLVPGHRRVNHIGYVVSEKAWVDDRIEVAWMKPDDYEQAEPEHPRGRSYFGQNTDGGMTLIAHTSHSDVTSKPAAVSQKVTVDWEPDGTGSYSGSSSSGWGTRALIVPPEAGDGETFYWRVRQNGWTWDGRCDSLAEAQQQAQSESNRMLAMQEAEGIDWDATADDGGWDDEDDQWF